MLTRRTALKLLAGSAFGLTAAGHQVLAAPPAITPVDLRGAIDAAEEGLIPGASDNQSKRFQQILDKAARRAMPVYLPPGTYTVSNIELPDGTRLVGAAGASRLIYGGDGHLLRAENATRIEISDIAIDGANRWLADYTEALLSLRSIGDLFLDNCEILGSRKNAVKLERCGGRIERCRIAGAADTAIYAIESTGLSISGNRIEDCGNGGILVHRWTKGPDNSMITGNRIARIGASDGGTGEHGNGINLFRADNAMVINNHVSDCAFSAIRANSSSNAQISGNQCLASGETAIYAEFSFEGAIVSGNVIDGAANGIIVCNFNEGGRMAAVTGNIVRNLSLTGPYVHDGAGFGFGIAVEADTVVSDNVIENAPKWGMMLGWGPYLRNVIASGNVIRTAPIGLYVTVVEESGSALITGNLFDDTPNGAIIGYRWNDKATGELLDDAGDYAHLTISGNRVV
ncbi:TIGR03808 family TAT-translocated repetitive protein [Agrobacterium sp. a22-2]|uniref:TIGR03808 family TAT-translocated repetitive protein n=1 Tax=Agrobacterium sp. a22-2 TaxID=2283840 RepID=UPI001445AC52|nr:TIGR03808 family TAT-translocated repetitive protein [Agrobacterium sp. a22-2]NKN39568.1 TIGR03808 family TAT-translocated repetitive protein [Agrobacterium sp. a22-2]